MATQLECSIKIKQAKGGGGGGGEGSTGVKEGNSAARPCLV